MPHLKKTKCFITGGVRTVVAMADILETGLDGIGLGRPSATEPHLPRDILENGVMACVKPVLDEQDISNGLIVSGAQIRQMGRGESPLDPSDPEAVKLLKVKASQ